ncbi:hypothetical protein [Aliivibrio fischeri]|uniref:hypothetical protein n=2 Tax=Aliivibrio fischeri TaxID=668 RepID=UPI0007C5ABAD|nr:hypothetical protein [Aliivibrio fischeri]MUI54214.1 hypothetical protein [Aliivibrio fischeri]
MATVTQNIEPKNTNSTTMNKKASYSLFIIFLIIIANSVLLDRMAHEAVNDSLSSAIITFGTASLLDSFISMFKSVELSVGLASFDIGQLLNSISDMLDLFKYIMALALASLSLQKFLLVTMSSKLFNFLLVISAGALLSTLWVQSLASYKAKATQIFKVLLIVRFSVIVSVSLSLGADYLFIDKSIKENESQATELSMSISQQMEVLTSLPEEVVTGEEDRGFMSEMSKKWNTVKSTVSGPKDMIITVMESIDNAMIKFINLMMLFVLKTIILPLLFLMAFKKFVIEVF